MNVNNDLPADLRVLLLEDNRDDAALLRFELKRAGYIAHVDRVDSRESFLERLSPDYDVIISDHEMPQFDALEALDLAVLTHPEIPFLIVSGTIREETAVEAMRRGAADYLLKDRLARLGSAIERALELRRQRVEKERAFAELRRIHTAVESAGDAIVIIAPDGTHLFHNHAAERLSGYTFDELKGHRECSAFFVDEKRALQVKETLRTGRSWSGQAELKRRDGTIVPTSIRADAIFDKNGRVEGLVCIFSDISDQKRYEEQLIRARTEAQELARMKSTFLMTMSHEFRTPLTGILGFAEILNSTVSDEDREFVGFIYTSGMRLLNTLNAVLELAQIESGHTKLRLGSLNVTREIRRIVQKSRSDAASAGLDINCKVQEPVYALADAEAFEHVLGQLLSNAIKFTDNGQITVDVRSSEGFVQIDVTDTGVGISSDFLPHVFEAFKQESMGESREFEGTGIGLTVAKGFVELMGGRITVKSRKGAGSTFTIVLEQPGQRSQETAVAAPGRRKLVSAVSAANKVPGDFADRAANYRWG